jgi:hypothetical protein
VKNLGKQLKALWKDESAQGATEYILLLVAIVALLAIFRDKLTGPNGIVSQMIGNLTQNINDFMK